MRVLASSGLRKSAIAPTMRKIKMLKQILGKAPVASCQKIPKVQVMASS